MAKTKRVGGLGQGLQALFPGLPTESSGTEAHESQMIAIESIRMNPYQPRSTFDEENLKELSDSIKAHGVLQPVLVRRKDQGYELIAGERRIRAAKLVGLSEIPALIRELTDHEALELAIIENVQREDLDPVEEARAYKQLATEFKQTQEQIASKVSKSRSYVANSIRLLQLSPQILDLLERGALTIGHVRPLLSLDEEVANALALHMVDTKATVREAEQWTKEAAKGGYAWIREDTGASLAEGASPLSDKGALREKRVGKEAPLPVELTEIQRIIRELVNTKVEITTNSKGGKIIIDYYSPDDVARILELFTGNREIDR